MEKRRKILVVNGDDFGLSSGINCGIEKAFLRGILRSASLMPNGPAFDDAVRIARSNPSLGVGIHLSLVDERCAAPEVDVRGLAGENGSLPSSWCAFCRAYALRRFGVREVRKEVKAQVARVLDAGIRPTHIDSHQHLHMLPGIFDIVLTAAKEAGIPIIRIPMEIDSTASAIGAARRIHIRLLRLLCRAGMRKVRKSGLRFADHFRGLSESGNMNEENLARVLMTLREGVNELMCHPGFADEATSKRYPWGYHWDDEAAALCSPAALQIVREQDIRLSSPLRLPCPLRQGERI